MSPMPSAHHFGLLLQKEFRRRSASAGFGEVAQFRALKDAFGALRPKFQIEEYHGSRRQVYFRTTQPWLRPRARCELCDLLFIVYSTTGHPQVRLMLLQAKLSRSNHTGLCSSLGLHRRPTEFCGNYEQWDLLAYRPKLDPTGVFSPPPDLLSSALVPSVGAFGVFHNSTVGTIDMFYASADTLRPVGSPTTRYGKLSTAAAPIVRWFSGFPDTPFCCCLLTFGESLFDLRLGTPIVGTSTAGETISNNSLSSFAKGVLATHAREEGGNSILLREVLALLGGAVDQMPSDESVPSLVILKSAAASMYGQR